MADVLSRNFKEEEEVLFTSNSIGVPGSLLDLSGPIYTILDEIKAENESKARTKELLEKHTKTGEGSTSYVVKNGILFFKNRYYLNEDFPLIKKILYELHDSQLGGHSGIHRTWKRVAKYFFCPNMGVQIKKYVKECLVCQQVKSSNTKMAGLLMPLPYPQMCGKTLAWIL